MPQEYQLRTRGAAKQQPLVPVDEEEFLFYSQAAISAGQLEAPLKKNPSEYV
jgi:hypothetical protein